MKSQMKKYRKSTWLCGALLIYVTAMAIYLVPRNHNISELERYVTVATSYVVVLLLWLVLRKKEKLADERRKDMQQRKNNSQEFK
jgi:Ca2+/Na+ antiporter